MRDLASTLSGLPAVRSGAPWRGYEHVKGWGVFGLPFDSGHVLALRVFPENDFGPYVTLWHRDPGGRWTIHVDGARLDTACPRYYGAACEHTGFAHIGLRWSGPATLAVSMDRPRLEWTLTARSGLALDVLNVISAVLPLATWRPHLLVRARALMARAFGLGDLELFGVMPSGHDGLLMPQEMFLIEESTARLEGVDLGRPAHLRENPAIGEVPLPARGVLAIGRGMFRIRDQAEYERTRRETAGVEVAHGVA